MNRWILAARPKTLWAGVAPVVMAAAMAYADGGFHLLSVVAALTGSVAIQVGANYANDYFDFVKGSDTAARTGPTRITQAGLVSPTTMRRATIAVFAFALIPGLYIVCRGGWPYLVIGLVSIACGVLYTAGPIPIGYIGLGELFVLVFFGPVALCGTYYLQTGALPVAVWVAGLAPGLLSVALLTVNNYRDIDEDRSTGKRTLAVRFGRTFARLEYIACLCIASFCVPLTLWVLTGNGLVLGAGMVVFGFGIPAIWTLCRTTDGEVLNRVLAKTGKLLLVFSILFSLAWVLGSQGAPQ